MAAVAYLASTLIYWVAFRRLEVRTIRERSQSVQIGATAAPATAS
jgi:hypothetical protein